MNIDTETVVTIIGWPVTAVLAFFAGLALARATREKKKIAWAIRSESELLAVDTAKEYDVNMKIMVNGVEETRVSSAAIAIKSAGNKEILNFRIYLTMNKTAVIHMIRPSVPLGRYAEKIKVSSAGHNATIDAQYMNPGQEIGLELLISNYEIGSLMIEVAEPGVDCEQVSGGSWNIEFNTTDTLQSMGLSLFGLRYDAAANQTRQLVKEVFLLRRSLETIMTDARPRKTVTRPMEESDGEAPDPRS